MLLLPRMVEGGGCAVMVSAGVVVGVVAARMAEGEGGGCSLSKKKREKNYHNTVRFIILFYVISKSI